MAWKEDEFVSFEEYAYYGIDSETYEKNERRSRRQGVSVYDMCPLCAKALKEGSYRTLHFAVAENGVSLYYNNPNAIGNPIKVGNGCYRRLLQAYKAKYSK